MATTLEMVEWELPILGMNADVSPSQIPAKQCAVVQNYITGEPGQLRLRQGTKTAAWINRSNHTATGGRGEVGGGASTQSYYGSSTTDFDSDTLVCLGVAVFGDQALVTVGNYSGTGVRGDWIYGTAFDSGAIKTLNVRTYVMRAPLGVINTTLYEPIGTGTGTEEQKIWTQGLVVDGGGTFPLGPPFPAVNGRGVAFDERVFFVCPMTQGNAGRKPIQCWAGAGGVDITAAGGNAPASTNGLVNAVSVKVNNGAKSVDFTNESSAIQTTLKLYNLLYMPKITGTGGINGTADNIKEAYYTYRLDGRGVAFTQEYGRGALVGTVPNEAPVSSATRNFHVRAVAPVVAGPYGAVCINEFQGRLFAFAGSVAAVPDASALVSTTQGTLASVHPNLVQWSTGIAEEWPAENSFFIDDASNDVIMAANTIGGVQIICTKTSTYVLSGYDEDSFELDVLTRHDGCLDNKSMQNIDGRLYWLGNEGLWSWSGSGLPTRESHPRSGVGIRSDIFLQRAKTGDVVYNTQSALGRVRDRLVFAQQNIVPSAAIRTAYTYHPSSGSFARWNLGALTHYILSPTTGQRQQAQQFFFDFQGRNMSAGANTVWELTHLFDEVGTSAGDDPPAEHVTTDAARSTADAASADDISGRIQFRDMIVRPGRTIRWRSFTVEHACQHDGTNSAFEVNFGVDPSQHTLSGIVHTVAARDYDGAGTVEYDNGRYFVDRIILDGTDISPEAQVFRVRFEKPSTTGFRNDGGHKIFRAYAMLDVTRNLRVDSTMV